MILTLRRHHSMFLAAALAFAGQHVIRAQQPGHVPLTLTALAASSPAGGEEFDSDVPIRANLQALPALPPPQFTAGRPTRKDERMNQAEAMYDEGRKLYSLGDLDGARARFDRALDLVLDSKAEPVNRSRFDQRFETLVQKIYRFDLEGLGGSVASPESPQYDKAPIDDVISLTFPVDPKLKLKVRGEVEATASQLPLEASDAVLSFINYFSGEKGRRTLIAGLRRAGKYKDMISRILDEEGVPQEFIFLAQAESGFLPRAISYKAAGGMWQFIRETGNTYGLQQTAYVDQRFDPELATRAAARHLRDLYNYFGDWYLAIAGYNCGAGNVDRAVEKTGYADIWELRSRGTLPLETSNYVPIILAMTIMSKNLSNYGIEDVALESALTYDKIDVTELTSLALISDLTNLPVSELRDLNPALLKDIAPPGYSLRIPKGSANTVMAGLPLVPSGRRASWRMYHAEAGDGFPDIARRFNTGLNTLQAANASVDGEIAAGSWVVVPAAPAPPPSRYVRKTTAQRIAVKRPVRRSVQTAAVRGRVPSRSAAKAVRTGSGAKSPIRVSQAKASAKRRPA